MSDQPDTSEVGHPTGQLVPVKVEAVARSRHPVDPDEQGNLLAVVEMVFDKIDPLVKLVESFGGQALKAKEAEGRFKTNMAWFAASIVLIVVGSSAFLTYEGKLDGSTFGFLLGLVVGYVLSFIRDAIYPPKQS